MRVTDGILALFMAVLILLFRSLYAAPVHAAGIQTSQSGDGTYVITCRLGMCTEVEGEWRAVTRCYSEEDCTDSWYVKPATKPDLRIWGTIR